MAFRQAPQKALEIGVLAELGRVLPNSAYLALEGCRDVDDVVNVIAHDQQNLADAVRHEPGDAVGRVEESGLAP
jgi:hypothetical protein